MGVCPRIKHLTGHTRENPCELMTNVDLEDHPDLTMLADVLDLVKRRGEDQRLDKTGSPTRARAGGARAQHEDRVKFLSHFKGAAEKVRNAELGLGFFVLLLSAECTEYFNRDKGLVNLLPEQRKMYAKKLEDAGEPRLAELLRSGKFDEVEGQYMEEALQRCSRAIS